jgi:hypothetical protein
VDKYGNIYYLENNEDKQSVIEELDLVEIPEEDFNVITNMNEKERINWYKEQKALVTA